jgi:hypothetical protein
LEEGQKKIRNLVKKTLGMKKNYRKKRRQKPVLLVRHYPRRTCLECYGRGVSSKEDGHCNCCACDKWPTNCAKNCIIRERVGVKHTPLVSCKQCFGDGTTKDYGHCPCCGCDKFPMDCASSCPVINLADWQEFADHYFRTHNL